MDKKILFIGGDKRQYYAARKLREHGFEVYMYGFEKLSDNDIPEPDDLYFVDIIVLPITGLRGGKVPAYYSDKEIKIDESILSGKLVFMGKAESFDVDIPVCDLLKREDFALANALPSAEGAIQVAMENYDGTISGANALVIGYGRIGAALAKILSALNAEVTVASRKDIKCYSSVFTSEIDNLSVYDIVFNTADALIIDESVLKNSDNKPLIIDLSSRGGVDFEAAEKLGFKALHALGLPGKCSPKAAGEIICDAILQVLKEEYGWQRRI